MKKMTKKEAYSILLTFAEVRENPEIMEIIEREIVNLDKRAAAPRKPSKTQVENAVLGSRIAGMLEPGKVYTTAEVVEIVNEKEGTEYSIQKLSRVLATAEGIERIQDKRKVSWKLAA